MSVKKISLLIITLLTITITKADNYYWVGDVNGNGEWEQVTNWRVNGLPASSVPSSSDNVFFDRTNSHRVTIKADVRCNNITVTGWTRFYATSGYFINIYGSANFNATTIRITGAAFVISLHPIQLQHLQETACLMGTIWLLKKTEEN